MHRRIHGIGPAHHAARHHIRHGLHHARHGIVRAGHALRHHAGRLAATPMPHAAAPAVTIVCDHVSPGLRALRAGLAALSPFLMPGVDVPVAGSPAYALPPLFEAGPLPGVPLGEAPLPVGPPYGPAPYYGPYAPFPPYGGGTLGPIAYFRPPPGSPLAPILLPPPGRGGELPPGQPLPLPPGQPLPLPPGQPLPLPPGQPLPLPPGRGGELPPGAPPPLPPELLLPPVPGGMLPPVPGAELPPGVPEAPVVVETPEPASAAILGGAAILLALWREWAMLRRRARR